MAENVLEDFKCAKCSSAVRAGSIFCFHCGAAIEQPKKNKANVSDAWFKESIVEGQEATLSVEPKGKPKIKPKAEPKNEPKIEVETKATVAEETIVDEQKAGELAEDEIQTDADLGELKSAASIRKRPKTVGKKSVEVVWEEPEGSTIAWFVVAVLVLVAIAVGLILAAWYLK
jgi:hypothetical protein